jgi:putative lipoprotein
VGLPLASSAPDVSYGEGLVFFRATGDDAALEIGDKKYENCKNNRAKAIWEDAKFRGVDFRAVGNEPGWNLELTAGEQILFVGDYGKLAHRFVTSEPAIDQQARTTTYKGQDSQHDFKILIEGRSCRDSMSGEAFDTTVTVTLDNKEYRGCGKALH